MKMWKCCFCFQQSILLFDNAFVSPYCFYWLPCVGSQKGFLAEAFFALERAEIFFQDECLFFFLPSLLRFLARKGYIVPRSLVFKSCIKLIVYC